jgi:hypothetical protein
MASTPPTTSRRRTHPMTGWAYAGSQRQIQAYVNTSPLTAVLDTALAAALPTIEGATIEWLSPLAAAGYVEYQDASFWQAIGKRQLAARAAGWWPARGGPCWDALALANQPGGGSTLVLVEAKAHVDEFGPAPCGATGEMSIAKIRAAFDSARQQLGSSASTDTWMGGYYQLANRLTWALWLRDHHVDTVFAHVLFADDRSNIPATIDELRDAAHQAHATLGVAGSATAGWAATIVLDATR